MRPGFEGGYLVVPQTFAQGHANNIYQFKKKYTPVLKKFFISVLLHTGIQVFQLKCCITFTKPKKYTNVQKLIHVRKSLACV